MSPDVAAQIAQRNTDAVARMPPKGTRVYCANGEPGTVTQWHCGGFGYVGVLWDSIADQGRTTAFVYHPSQLKKME